MANTKGKYLRIAIIAAFIVIWWLLFGCVFQTFFGVPCPGCGMTRAWMSALSGNFSAAFRWHPLFWAVPLLAVLVLFQKRLPSKLFLVTLLIFGTLIIGVYIIRLILLAPHTPPMTLNQNAFLWTVFGYLYKLISG